MTPTLFVVPKEHVIAALETKHCNEGERFSLKTSVNPSNKTSLNTARYDGTTLGKPAALNR